MKLTGQQHQQLQEALMDAYRDVAALRQMLRFRLDKNLHTITMGGNLKDIVFELIDASQAEGWTEKLIVGARESNPGNALLKAFAQQVGLAPATPALQNGNIYRERGKKEYDNLTDNQKRIAKWFVKQVRLGNLSEEFFIGSLLSGKTLLSNFNGDSSEIPEITEGALRALHNAELIIFNKKECTFLGKIYQAVDSDFNAPDM